MRALNFCRRRGRAYLCSIALSAATPAAVALAATSCGGASASAYGSGAAVVPVGEGGEAAGQAGLTGEPTERVFEGKLEAPLRLEATVTSEGVWLSTSSGPVATGCLHLGGGVTIPMRDEAYDKPAITACARRLKRARAEFADESAVTVYGLATLKYNAVIEVVGALRGDEGEELFPDVTVSVKR
jgi:hypothetical protein